MPRMFGIRWMSPRTSAAGALRSAHIGVGTPAALPSPERLVSAGVDGTAHPEGNFGELTLVPPVTNEVHHGATATAIGDDAATVQKMFSVARRRRA